MEKAIERKGVSVLVDAKTYKRLSKNKEKSGRPITQIIRIAVNCLADTEKWGK